MTTRAFIYAQHLVGTGHLRRAGFLAKSLAHDGMAVVLASGGEPIAGLDIGAARLEQLPALRTAPGDMRTLIDTDGRPVDDAFKIVRTQQLLASYRAFQPDILVVEMFPFGRRQMRFELLPLLEAARASNSPPLVICSVRDILQTGRAPKRLSEAADWVERYFDAVLVHGDPDIARLDDTFPLADRFKDRIVYTGYLAPPLPDRPPQGSDGWGEIIVSSAGGAVGETLLRTALDARHLSGLGKTRWRILAGHGLPTTAYDALLRSADPGCVVERSRDDFRSLLRVAKVSVSQAGYNTSIDILQSEARAVIVPYAAFGETEQTFRAKRLSDLGLAVVLQETDLAPETLASAIEQAAELPRVDHRFRLDGAEQTVAVLRQLLSTR